VNKWSVRKVIVVGVLATVAIWLVALGPAFLLAWWLPGTRLGELGTAGDMFGAGSALFNGLGFFAVVLVLYFDLRERRRDLTDREQDRKERRHNRTPFLVASVIDQGVRVVRAQKLGSGPTETTLVLDIVVQNVTAEPAMNVKMTCVDRADHEHKAIARLDDTPFGVGEASTREATAHFSASGPQAENLLRRLAAGQPTTIEVGLEYDSINTTRWSSKVDYELSCSGVESRNIFQRILDGDDTAYISEGVGFSSTTDEYLAFKVVPNTWKHAASD
jgi:hypothetical protein